MGNNTSRAQSDMFSQPTGYQVLNTKKEAIIEERSPLRETKKGSIAIGHRGRMAITILPYVESKSASPPERKLTNPLPITSSSD